ncbi:MAG: hypothetical protein KGJ93_04340 [Patescibacteria group bacterium]|nr:hypothetical protein [Patescibacteria group bacterium]
MYNIDRSAAIIKPKKPFIEWANHVPDADREYTDEVFEKDCTVILIANYSTEKEAREQVNDIWEDIFDYELYSWCTEEMWWPKDRTKEMFWQWFSVEYHSEIIDPFEDEIQKEDL